MINMKATLKGSLLLLIASATIWSACTKSNEAKAYLNPGANPMFNSTISTIVLLQPNANNTAGTFSWSAADFGFKAAVTYSIQLLKNLMEKCWI